MITEAIQDIEVTRMRRGFHVVSWWNGFKTHPDGSPAKDMKGFSQARNADKFARKLASSPVSGVNR